MKMNLRERVLETDVCPTKKKKKVDGRTHKTADDDENLVLSEQIL